MTLSDLEILRPDQAWPDSVNKSLLIALVQVVRPQ